MAWKSRLLALALTQLTVADPAHAQDVKSAPTTTSVHILYAVRALSITVGTLDLSFQLSERTYSITGLRRAIGWPRLAVGVSQDFTYTVEGDVDPDGGLHPRRYQHRGGRRDRVVTVRFEGDQPITTSNQRQSPGNPPVSAEQRRGAIDQLSAIARMIAAPGDPCQGAIKVLMEGRGRFDFVMHPDGEARLSGPAYRGLGQRCRVDYLPIGGFHDPQEPAELTFLFATTDAGVHAPTRIQMPTDDVGVVTLEAQTLTVNGQALH
jgi:Protein of unknown function (DUF3108)